jgi:hypothetical protein
VHVGGENALPCFMPNVIDEVALQRVVYNTQPWGTPLQQARGSRGSGGSGGSSGGSPPSPAGPGNGGFITGGGGGSNQDMYNSNTSPAGISQLQPPPQRSSSFDTAMPSLSQQQQQQQQTSSGSPPLISSSGGSGGSGGLLSVVNADASARLPPMRNFTFLRLTPEMMSPSYFDKWQRFMLLMAHNAQKYKSSPRWRQNMGFSSSQ